MASKNRGADIASCFAASSLLDDGKQSALSIVGRKGERERDYSSAAVKEMANVGA